MKSVEGYVPFLLPDGAFLYRRVSLDGAARLSRSGNDLDTQAENKDGQRVPHPPTSRSHCHYRALSGHSHEGFPTRTAQGVSAAHTRMRHGKHTPQKIARLCGIQKTLTYHMARHTFASQMTLSEGVSIESVSKMLGHSQIKTTQVYAETSPERVFLDIEKILPQLAHYQLTN